MVLNTILVHLDDTPQSPLRYQLALQLAQKQQACLTAFYSTASTFFARGGEQPQRQQAKADCVSLAEQAGVELIWVEEDETEAILPLTTRVIYQAAYADLCIIGQPGKQPPPPRDLPERLIISSGHPVITIPFAGSFKTFGTRVMIAWKAGRASARAIADAMPILKQAEEVFLISFSSNLDERKENDRTMEKMADYLKQHQVRAQLENRLIEGIGLGDALLNRAAEEGIDLLVCGGMVAGQMAPLASLLLKQMTVPVLMSS